MLKFQKGFSLVELMVVIAIIAILAAVAFPIYSNYVIRSKVGAAVTAIGSTKMDIAEIVMHSGEMTNINSTGIGSSATFNTKALPSESTSSLSYTTTVLNSSIIISFTIPVSGSITLTPYYNTAAQSMTWECTSLGFQPNQLPTPLCPQ
ncbi:prepilin-type N-terminal cleavage/methylation domain-containing protein [Francisella philomiragia]|uniref:pilin n=1 Tax=Francisella philomiragia TaxID=28110 RepID=UPI0035154E64